MGNRTSELRKAFSPELVEIAGRARELLRTDITKAKRYAKRAMGTHLLKVAVSAGIYQGTALTFGVGAWDIHGTFSRESSIMGNTSQLSIYLAKGISNLIPQEIKAAVASAIVPMEFSLSFVRMIVENKVYQRFGITPDPAGTLLKPYTAGILETAHKLASANPTNTEELLEVGIISVYGDIVRMA
ncbi:MAG: hypothetical protein KGH98_02935 [Candidatus Micrarchaeota archaeon]|nr:hypothetical protein [Candidatus Micrarchaeota archaeon]